MNEFFVYGRISFVEEKPNGIKFTMSDYKGNGQFNNFHCFLNKEIKNYDHIKSIIKNNDLGIITGRVSQGKVEGKNEWNIFVDTYYRIWGNKQIQDKNNELPKEEWETEDKKGEAPW